MRLRCFLARFHIQSLLLGLGLALVGCEAESGGQNEQHNERQGVPAAPAPAVVTGSAPSKRLQETAAEPHVEEQTTYWAQRLPESRGGGAAAWGGDLNVEVFTDSDARGNTQLFAAAKAAEGAFGGGRHQLTFDDGEKFDPALAYIPSLDEFVLVYAAQTAQHQRGIYAATLSRNLKISSPVAITDPNLTFDGPRAVWVASRQQIFVVFHSETAVYGAWISTPAGQAPAAAAAFALTQDRQGRVSSPTVAYAATTDQLMVAWGVMRSQENIELGVMRPADPGLAIPNMQTWSHKRRECSPDMAPACIEGGDQAALAYNPGLRKFGLAIADDLNDGSRVEGFLLSDDCSAAACSVHKIGQDDFPSRAPHERERALATMASVASVAIAPIDAGFVVGFAFGNQGPSEPEHIAVVSFDDVGHVTPATVVSDVKAKHVALSSAGATSTASEQANLLFRQRLSSSPQAHRQSVTIYGTGAAPQGRPMRMEH